MKYTDGAIRHYYTIEYLYCGRGSHNACTKVLHRAHLISYYKCLPNRQLLYRCERSFYLEKDYRSEQSRIIVQTREFIWFAARHKQWEIYSTKLLLSSGLSYTAAMRRWHLVFFCSFSREVVLFAIFHHPLETAVQPSSRQQAFVQSGFAFIFRIFGVTLFSLIGPTIDPFSN